MDNKRRTFLKNAALASSALAISKTVSAQDADSTGFLRIAPWDRSNLVAAEVRQNYLSEVTTSTASIFLGLTVGCARCHDHKYDPIPQRDFYRLQAFFNAIQVEDRQGAITRPEVESGSVGPAGDFDQVVTELRLHGTVGLSHLGAEHDLVELGHHLAGAELAQVTTLTLGRTTGVLAGDFGEIGASFNLSLEVVGGFLGIDQDVSGGGLRHGDSPLVCALGYASRGIARGSRRLDPCRHATLRAPPAAMRLSAGA